MKTSLSILLGCAFLLISTLTPTYLIAAEISDDQRNPLMPAVTVEADRISATTGTSIIDKELIESLPTRGGSINEIIRFIPGVQFDESALNSFTAGEIFPPVISISGSRFYDNNYTIDGNSNNSPLDPASAILADANKLPGHPQIQFLDPKIIDQVTVYNSNIPAEFGGFTGGQVDTKTIDPGLDFWGNIHYRTTRDNWTKFYVSDADQNSFLSSTSVAKQPKFKKHNAGFTLNIPIGLDTGIVTSYQQTYSSIPLLHLGEENTQTRRRENYFAKLGHHFSNVSRVFLTATYSPTRAEYFLKDFRNSDYQIESGGYSLAMNFENEGTAGKLDLTLGYNGQKTERTAPNSRFFWNPSTATIDWESGKEGGLGNLETGNNQLNLNLNYTMKPLQLGNANHLLKTGFKATYSSMYYERPDTSYYYYSPILTAPINCTAGDPACIDNEQFLSRRTVYYQTQTDSTIYDYALFFQDSIAWSQLEIFPGLRASYDNFTDNLNIAPRFSTSFDLFGNRKTILFAGKNRYYSGTLVTHALYKTIRTENQIRTSTANGDGDWSKDTPSVFTENDVETPYSDELTIGFLQRLFGGELKFQYIDKTNKKEFARTRIRNTAPIPDYYLLNNNGRSEHESFQVSWQRSWGNHYLELNSSWQETTSSNSDYDNILDEDDLVETIWYEGQELYKYQIPRSDFNRPVVANIIYSGRLPYGINFTNTAKFRGPYWRLKYAGRTEPSLVNPGVNSRVYEKDRRKSSLIFDWRFSYKIPSSGARNIVLTVDIYNVFNRRAEYGAGSDDYELGRQYWAGIDFNF